MLYTYSEADQSDRRLGPAQKGNGNGYIRPRFTAASDPQEVAPLPIGALHQLRLQLVQTRQESSLWNELVERYHYLNYKPLAGAQTRFMVFHDAHLLAVLGLSAAA